MSDVLVYAQMDDGQLNDVGLQCMGAARQIADATGGTVACVAVGDGVSAAAGGLFAAGADAVYVADGPAYAPYLTTPHVAAVKAALAACPASVVLLPATTSGDDLAPILAVAVDGGCLMNCDGVSVDGAAPTFQRREFDRKVMSSYAPTGDQPMVVTLSDGAVSALEADPARSGEPVALEVTGAETAAEVVSRDVTAKSVNLKDARVIVAAGAGVGTQENFGKIRELAAAMGAEIGATRAVVDAGWLEAGHQIGQTGATVQPEIYIACGISGAVQHRVGMEDAKKIVAINSDKSAPIFRIAHYKVVGDLNVVIPRLLKLLEN